MPEVLTVTFVAARHGAEEAWEALRAGHLGALRLVADEDTAPSPLALFPGAFNPLHAGHLRIAELASARLDKAPHFEISLRNVDKAPLDLGNARARAAQFESLSVSRPLLLTCRPTFLEKAEIFPGSPFIVGLDTIVRIGDPRYYGSPAARDRAIARLVDLGATFLVFGRCDAPGRFLTLADVALPSPLERLCDGVSEREFRLDLSSTELRERPKRAGEATGPEE